MNQHDTKTLLATVASIPRDNDDPVFNAPWEAEVFAITLALHAKGLFEWKEWAAHLSDEISNAQTRGDPDLGDTYYQHWLVALEKIVISKKLGSELQLSGLYAAWDSAAHTTPHGKPIVLSEEVIQSCVEN